MSPRAREPLQSAALLLLGLSVVLTLAVAVALVFFTHPLSDDWCHAADARELGWLGCVESYYLTLTGRWPGFAVSCAVLTPADAVPAYRLALLAILGFEIFALWLLTATVLPLPGRPLLGGGLALTLFALHWAGMADPGQTVYWLEGALAYSLNLSLAIVIVSLLLRLPERLRSGSWMGVLALALLGMVTAGFHELFALVLLGVLLVGTAIGWLRGDPRRLAWATVAGGVALGFASGLFAPGNEGRIAMSPTLEEANPIPATVFEATRSLVRVLDEPVSRGTPVGWWGRPLGWVLDARLLAALLLFAASPAMRSLRPGWLERDPRLWRTVVPAISLAVLAGCFLAGSYAAVLGGLALPARVYNAIHLIFLLGVFLTVFVHTRWDIGVEHPGVRTLRAGSASVLALGLLFSTPLKLGLRDLTGGDAAAFDGQIVRRHEAAGRAREEGTRELVVPALDPWPESYFRGPSAELTADRESHHNACAARYFGVGSIRLVRPAR